MGEAPKDPRSRLALRHVTPAFRVYAGADSLVHLPRELARKGRGRALVICGRSIAQHDTALGLVTAALGGALAGVFDGVREHSPVDVVADACRAVEEAQADCLIAVGGGSAIVTSRAAAILAAEGGDIRGLATTRTGSGKLVSPRLDAPKLPQWVVPTTPTTAYAKAGTAVRDVQAGERLAMFDPKTRARGIFLHPDLAMTAPSSLVKSSSLNAFAMSVEGLFSGVDDPLALGLHAQALRLIGDWLPAMLDRADDPEPRLRLMLGALLAGQGSDFTGGGLAQAIAHAAGPRSEVANGVVEALVLPHTMGYAGEVDPQAEGLHLIADLLGTGIRPPDARALDLAVGATRRFLDRVGVPARLREVGLPRERLAEVTEHVLDDWVMTQIPRPIALRELSELLATAW